MKNSLWCFMRSTGPIAMAAALCVMSACASHGANSVPPEKIYGTGVGSVSDPARVNGGSSSTSGSYASGSSMTSSTSSGYSTASNNGSNSYNSTDMTSGAQTSVVQGTPTTTSSTTVRQVALPNASLPCESVTASSRPASAVTFYTLDPVSGVYLPAGTMSSAPSGSTTYYTYDNGNGWYTTSTTTTGGSQIYIQDPSNSNRMIPAGYAVISTRPCGSAYVVTTTTTTSTPVNVQTTMNNVPPPPPMTSSATTIYNPPTIINRTYRTYRSSSSLDVFATRLQFSGSNANGMFINGTPGTGTFTTQFQRENGWGLAFNGRLARMAELSIGGAYVKPQVTYVPNNFNNLTLNGGSMTVIPLDATLRFHLLPQAFIDPYLGGGATYMIFRDQKFNNFNNGLGGTGLQRVSYDNSWGWHAEGGVLFSFSHGFGINATARYNDVKPKVNATFLNANGTTTLSSSTFHMKPWQFNLGLRFGF